MRAEVNRSIVCSARRNMRAWALGWREARRWHDRGPAQTKLGRARLWRDIAHQFARGASIRSQLPALQAVHPDRLAEAA